MGNIHLVNDFFDETQIISKAVGASFELVSRLHIYSCPEDHNDRNCRFFMPRMSYNTQKEFLTQLYPNFKFDDTVHRGKAVFCALYDMEKIYTGISKDNVERLKNIDMRAYLLFKEWVDAYPNEQGLFEEGKSYRLHVLSSERRFVTPKFSQEQNNLGPRYCNLKDLRNEIVNNI